MNNKLRHGHRTMQLSSILGGCSLFRSDMLLIFNTVWLWFFCGTVFVCPQFLNGATTWYLDFSCCPLSRVLHVTLANRQRFGFAYNLITSLLATSCWRDPRLQFSAFSFLDSILVSALQPLSYSHSLYFSTARKRCIN